MGEWGEGREASTLILQPSFLIRNQPKGEEKTLSQLFFLQLGNDKLPKCVPGALLSLNCLFYWSTDHIWKSLGRQRSPIACAALMRARAQGSATSPAPRVPACPSPSSGRRFPQGQELRSPPFSPRPTNLWHNFHFKPNPSPSCHRPSPSGVQREGLNPDTGPDALVGGSKGNHLLLFQPDHGHTSDSWFWGDTHPVSPTLGGAWTSLQPSHSYGAGCSSRV